MIICRVTFYKPFFLEKSMKPIKRLHKENRSSLEKLCMHENKYDFATSMNEYFFEPVYWTRND